MAGTHMRGRREERRSVVRCIVYQDGVVGRWRQWSTVKGEMVVIKVVNGSLFGGGRGESGSARSWAS
jgi:hypothetical protein